MSGYKRTKYFRGAVYETQCQTVRILNHAGVLHGGTVHLLRICLQYRQENADTPMVKASVAFRKECAAIIREHHRSGSAWADFPKVGCIATTSVPVPAAAIQPAIQPKGAKQ
jgi:hypothetical protein